MEDKLKEHKYKKIIGDEIDLKLLKENASDPSKGWSAEYKFQIQLHGVDKGIGYINLRFEDTDEVINYIGHIGYGINQNYRGNKYSVKACNLLKKVMKDHSMKKVIITCNPDNYPSKNTCELLGAKFIEIIDVPEHLDCYSIEEAKKSRYEWLIE